MTVITIVKICVFLLVGPPWPAQQLLRKADESFAAALNLQVS